MDKLPENDKRFDFKRYQHAKKSRRMLIRFIIYAIVIGVVLYLILDQSNSQKENVEEEGIHYFDIETN